MTWWLQPTAWVTLLIVGLGAFGAGWVQGRAGARADHAAAVSKAQIEAAASTIRNLDNRLIASGKKVTRDQIIQSADARARDAVQRLRDRANVVPNTTDAACRADLARTRQSLGECAGEYRALGEQLEQRQSEVRELIEAWPVK